MLALLITAFAPWAYAEPPLPQGLGDEDTIPVESGPALPEGLDETNKQSDGPPLPEGIGDEDGGPPGEEGPALPTGLGNDDRPSPAAKDKDKPAGWLDTPGLPFDLSGFWEIRFGPYTQSVDHQRDFAVAETRLQLEIDKRFEVFSFHLTNDFVYDQVAYSREVDLETGEGWSDLRELNVEFSPMSFMDVKLGRQILTWGTGDLFFLNDLFPKDWNSFLIGRDTEYLKAPSDAVKLSMFSDWVNVDVVYAPAFDADRFVDGRRVDYYAPAVGGTVGRNAVRPVDRPNRWFTEDEWAARLYRRVGPWELAGYFYRGYWKSPMGSDPATGRGTFPGLNVYGGSIRGPLGEGIVNAEFAFYDSREDRTGDDPFTPNREVRALVGYTREVLPDFNVGVQYYLEHMLDHGDYRDTLPGSVPPSDRNRHVITTRLTLLTMMQNLEWSLFAFYSPSDEDAYLRPKVRYKIDDHWSVELGGNVFLGRHQHTFFGQFRDNSNIYLGARYSF